MTPNYVFADEAVLDLECISDAIATFVSEDAVATFLRKVQEKCRRTAKFPNMGKNYSDIDPNLQGLIIDNYIILDFPRSDGIDIARVVNGYSDLESLSIGQS